MSVSLAFGSCNRQALPQQYWEIISSYHPKAFLWIGDVVYPTKYTLDSLQHAYQAFLGNIHYKSFTKAVNLIDGIWDDHDYGVNDAGKLVEGRQQRQQQYVSFLTSSNNDTDESSNYIYLLDHDGLYHFTDVDMNGMNLKFIFLDTRSFRDSHYIRSLGEFKFPFSALIASAIRGLYSVLGYGRDYDGEVLGDAQWTWLRQTLQQSKADMNIIVSSIQILTTNPVVESWGHFPIQRQRLIELMRELNPSGLVFLSGDVHLGELSQASFERLDGTFGEWLEITSSGLTHTCGDGIINYYLCPLMMILFNKHRHTKNSFFIGKNFGLIEVSQPTTSEDNCTDIELCPLKWNVTISIESLSRSPKNESNQFDQKRVLEYKKEIRSFQPVSSTLIDSASSSNIKAVHFSDFLQIPDWMKSSLFMIIILSLVVFKNVVALRGKRKPKKLFSKSNDKKKKI
eukprot:gene16362-22300_t